MNEIPIFKTKAEETAFWETHSFSECVYYTSEDIDNQVSDTSPIKKEDLDLLKKAEEDQLQEFSTKDSKDTHLEESMLDYMKRTGSGVVLLKGDRTLGWITCGQCNGLIYEVMKNTWLYSDPVCPTCNHMVMGLSNPFRYIQEENQL